MSNLTSSPSRHSVPEWLIRIQKRLRESAATTKTTATSAAAATATTIKYKANWVKRFRRVALGQSCACLAHMHGSAMSEQTAASVAAPVVATLFTSDELPHSKDMVPWAPAPNPIGIDWSRVCTRDHWSPQFVSDAHYAWPRWVHLLGSLDDHWQHLILAVLELKVQDCAPLSAEGEYATIWQAFSQVPSSLLYHHRFVHGNLSHAVEVADSSLASLRALTAGRCWEESHPQARACLSNRRHDLQWDASTVIGMALLHDIGKALQYVHRGKIYGRFKLSGRSQQSSHQQLGLDLVTQGLALTPTFPQPCKDDLLNFMAVRPTDRLEGDYRFTSFEAICVHRADQVSAAQHRFAEVNTPTSQLPVKRWVRPITETCTTQA